MLPPLDVTRYLVEEFVQLELLTILAAAFVKLAIEFSATAPSAILETGNV
jgi:hypothetical protein